MAFNNNPDLSQLIAMFGPHLLSNYAGPGGFVPHMMPTQMRADQFAMRNYQQQTKQSALNLAGDNTDNVSQMLIGLRSAFTDTAPSNLNKAQAEQMAGLINSPVAKMLLGQVMGPENMEALLHGSRGDVSALGSALSRTGYFRDNPMGGGRMNADALTSYTRAVYSELYEPDGDLDQITTRARDTDQTTRDRARRRLKKAALSERQREKMTDDEIDATATIVEDADVVQRLTALPDAQNKVSGLYKKYVQGGKETDTTKQAETLVKFERAIKEADVLSGRETTITALRDKAEMTPVHELHGFMAGQVGQIQEHMFQRGLMPKTLGRMSSEERLKTLNEAVNDTPLSDGTARRIAREMAQTSLSDVRNNSPDAMKYRAETTDAGRAAIIDKKESEFRTKLDTARDEIKKAATGASDAKSTTELEQLPGVKEMASNVDGKRSADAIKKYTGAVAAIRDIFGDNGNPNAPMPALLAALEGLSGGAVGSMRPQQIETTLRQMQSIAKEAGIGFEQMASISTQVETQASALGLTAADAMRIKPAAMAAVKVMQDTGAFERPVYGQLNQAESASRTASLITAGAASQNASAMGALESIFRADPSRFQEGSEIYEAVMASRDEGGTGDYEYTDSAGKKRKGNIYELVGTRGELGIMDMLRRNDVDDAEYAAQRHNPANRQYVSETFGFRTQRSSFLRDMRISAVSPATFESVKSALTAAGVTDENQQGRINTTVSAAMSELILDTAGLELEAQLDELSQQAPEKIKEQLIKNGVAPATAASVVQGMKTDGMFDRNKLNQVVGRANSFSHFTTNQHLAQHNLTYGNGRDRAVAQVTARAEADAERRQALGMGYETAPMQRVADYLRQIGERGEKLTTAGLLDSVIQSTTDREVFENYFKDAGAGIDALSELQRESAITTADINAAKEQAQKNPTVAGTAALKKLAGIDPNAQLVTKEDATTALTTELTKKSAQELRQLYIAKFGAAPAETTKDALVSKLATTENAAVAESLRADFTPSLFTIEAASARATANLNTLKEGTVTRTDKTGGKVTIPLADIAEYRSQIEAGTLKGDAEHVKAGAEAALKAFGADAALTKEQKEKYLAAVTLRGDEGKAALSALKEDDTFLKNVGDGDRQKIFDLASMLQKGSGGGIGRYLGLDAIPSDKEFFPPESQQKFAETIAKAIKDALYPTSGTTSSAPPDAAGAQPQQTTTPASQSSPTSRGSRSRHRRSTPRPRSYRSAATTSAPVSQKEKPTVKEANDAALVQTAGMTSANLPPVSQKEKPTVKEANDAALAQSTGMTSANLPPVSQKEKPTVKEANDAALAQSTGTPPTAAPTPGVQQETKPSAADSGSALRQTLPQPASPTQSPAIRDPRTLPAGLPTVSPASSSGGAGQSAGASSVKLGGTLRITGLQEAILNAQGTQVIETDGAPVIVEPTRSGRTEPMITE
jgi:hypothetical protein